MAVRKIDSHWYVDFRFSHRRYRKRSPEDSKKGALSFERVLKQKLLDGIDINLKVTDDEREMIFKNFGNYWYTTYAETNNKVSTLRSKRMILDRHLIPAIGHIRLRDITSQTIESFKVKQLKKSLAPKTVNNHLSILSTCLHMANEWEYTDRVPKIRWLKIAEQKYDFLLEDECEALVSGTEDQMIREMVLCGIRTGMRRGEMLGLDWSAVDFQQRVITVHQSLVEGIMSSPKNGRIRHIPISDDLYIVLSLRKRLSGFVFNHDGIPLHHTVSTKQLYQACKAIGLREISWHVLRHTFASQLVMKGVPIRLVQALLGHSTIQMTERYSHLSPSSLGDAIAVLGTSKTIQSENFGQYMGSKKVISLPLALNTGE